MLVYSKRGLKERKKEPQTLNVSSCVCVQFYCIHKHKQLSSRLATVRARGQRRHLAVIYRRGSSQREKTAEEARWQNIFFPFSKFMFYQLQWFLLLVPALLKIAVTHRPHFLYFMCKKWKEAIMFWVFTAIKSKSNNNPIAKSAVQSPPTHVKDVVGWDIILQSANVDLYRVRWGLLCQRADDPLRCV